MHISDALLSLPVACAAYALSVGNLAHAINKIKREENRDEKLPLAAVAGAFVFAAQMINFTIPGTGSSGHIVGAILLSALAGAEPALLAITSVLLIQCLFFADGGLLALGANIFNMGVIPCFICYPLFFKTIIKQHHSYARVMTASVVACTGALQLGSFAVVCETTLSGITQIPFDKFILLMQPIHLAIGIIEGFATGAVLAFAAKSDKVLADNIAGNENASCSSKKVLIAFSIAAVIAGGILSLYASSLPDGLEWSVMKIKGENKIAWEDSVHEKAASVQSNSAIMPEYEFKSDKKKLFAPASSIAGLLGGGLVFAFICFSGYLLKAFKKKKSACH